MRKYGKIFNYKTSVKKYTFWHSFYLNIFFLATSRTKSRVSLLYTIFSSEMICLLISLCCSSRWSPSFYTYWVRTGESIPSAINNPQTHNSLSLPRYPECVHSSTYNCNKKPIDLSFSNLLANLPSLKTHKRKNIPLQFPWSPLLTQSIISSFFSSNKERSLHRSSYQNHQDYIVVPHTDFLIQLFHPHPRLHTLHSPYYTSWL